MKGRIVFVSILFSSSQFELCAFLNKIPIGLSDGQEDTSFFLFAFVSSRKIKRAGTRELVIE